MPYTFFVHASQQTRHGIEIQARVTKGTVKSGSQVQSITRLIWEKVVLDGEYLEDIIGRSETVRVDFGPLVHLFAHVIDAENGVPEGFSFQALLRGVPEIYLPLDGWILSDLESPTFW